MIKKFFSLLLLCCYLSSAGAGQRGEPFNPKKAPVYIPTNRSALQSQADSILNKIDKLQNTHKRSISEADKKSTQQKINNLNRRYQELQQKIDQAIQVTIDDNYYNTTVAIDKFVTTCDTPENTENSYLSQLLDDTVTTDHQACIMQCMTDFPSCSEDCDKLHHCKMHYGATGGSGVFLSKSSVLTNYHVIDDFIADKQNENEKNEHGENGHGIIIQVRNRYGEYAFANKVKWADPETDLAVLELTQPISNAVIPQHGDLSKVHAGDQVFSINRVWDVSINHLIDKHNFSANMNDDDYFYICTHCIVHSIPLYPGDSGGPIFSKEGLLIGINARTTRLDFFLNTLEATGWDTAKAKNLEKIALQSSSEKRKGFGPNIDSIHDFLNQTPLK